MAAPVERKVQASTATAAVCGMILWVLGRYVFKGAVPDVFVSWVYVLVPGVLTFAAGYLTKHTPRTLPVSVVQNIPVRTTGTQVTFSGPTGTTFTGTLPGTPPAGEPPPPPPDKDTS